MRAATTTSWLRRTETLFQSTQPMRAATTVKAINADKDSISIHAAHEGCDRIRLLQYQLKSWFQSTQPMRAATANCFNFWHTCKFQSTQPMRAATAKERKDMRNGFISIHAAHEGCDLKRLIELFTDPDFNPRSPWGLRQYKDRTYYFIILSL